MSDLTEVQWRAQGVKVFYLLTQRPEGGLLAGLWEFPSVVLGEGECEGQGDGEVEEGGAEGKGTGGGKSGGVRGKNVKKKQQQQQQEGGDYSNAVCREAVDGYMRGELGILASGGAAAAAGGCRSKLGSCGGSKQAMGPSAAVEPLQGSKGAEARGEGAGKLQLVDRCHMGDVVHIFSHIRQVNHVEQLVLVAESLGDVCPGAVLAEDPAEAAAAAAVVAGGAAGAGGSSRGGGGPKVMCWVQQEALKGFGLTAGVRKALALVQKGS
jgi:A/G-specific adenine glycosylase